MRLGLARRTWRTIFDLRGVCKAEFTIAAVLSMRLLHSIIGSLIDASTPLCSVVVYINSVSRLGNIGVTGVVALDGVLGGAVGADAIEDLVLGFTNFN